MDQLGISKELPAADETDPEMLPLDGKTIPSSPGARTPGRSTYPPGQAAKNRISDPNARGSRPGIPGARTSNPKVRASQAGARQARPPSQPPATLPPPSSRVGLFVGLAAVAVGIIAAGAFYMIRTAQKDVDLAAEKAAEKAAKAAKVAAAKAEEEQTPVFLSVISDPLEADVVATWKDGEKRGPAPLAFEVPRNVKVHFAFSKTGYIGTEKDIIADQAQQVKAQLKPTPVAVETPAEKKPQHVKGGKKPEEKKPDAPPSKDGLIDLDDALK